MLLQDLPDEVLKKIKLLAQHDTQCEAVIYLQGRIYRKISTEFQKVVKQNVEATPYDNDKLLTNVREGPWDLMCIWPPNGSLYNTWRPINPYIEDSQPNPMKTALESVRAAPARRGGFSKDYVLLPPDAFHQFAKTLRDSLQVHNITMRPLRGVNDAYLLCKGDRPHTQLVRPGWEGWRTALDKALDGGKIERRTQKF